MAQTRKPDYFFTPQGAAEAEQCLEEINPEVARAADDRRAELDFDEPLARGWPDDDFAW